MRGVGKGISLGQHRLNEQLRPLGSKEIEVAHTRIL